MTAPDAAGGAGGSRSGASLNAIVAAGLRAARRDVLRLRAGLRTGLTAGLSKRKLRANRLGKPAGTGPTSAAGKGAFGAERSQARPQCGGDV